MRPAPMDCLVCSGRLPVQTAFNRMAAIQEEIARIDDQLATLYLTENMAATSPKEAPTDESIDQTIAHMLAVELCQLSASGDTVGIRVLLSGGADCNCVDYHGRTPLHLACLMGHVTVARVLLEFGADVTATDKEGKTPMDLAVRSDTREIVELLMSHCICDSSGGARSPPQELDGVLGEGLQEDSPLTATHPDFSSLPRPMMGSLIVIMVGLPARGKMYTARQIQRYFQWNGLQSSIFTYDNYVHQLAPRQPASCDITQDVDMELRVAKAIAHDMTHFIHQEDGVAVLAGSNVTSVRRMALFNAVMETGHIRQGRVVFVEVINTVSERIRNNVLLAKEMVTGASDRFVEEYYEKMEQLEAVYTSLDPVVDKDLTYIRVENGEVFSLNNISGWMPSRLAYMLHNLNPCSHNIYLTRSGEYIDLVDQRIGGNSPLTERGRAYGRAIFEYFRREHGAERFVVMSSCAVRCTETVHYFDKRNELSQDPYFASGSTSPAVNCRVSYLPTLDDINRGDCEGMLLSDVRRTMPGTLRNILDDPYLTAWPNGECTHQVFIARLEPLIHDIQASDHSVLVVSHLHLLQGLYSYFVCKDGNVIAPQNAYTIDIPLECVVKIRRVGDNRVAEIIDLSHEVDRIAQLYHRGAQRHCRRTEDFNKL
ncbi:6-phosphofructo-2-kinase/fructose-2 [Trypanosoma brucei equiperdum]|uniref:6-phosphofructo-2-kinase/fructose-2 n=1 Tax=Trypanosoma brucei equiperdum TaxID=630700 RepID=A0A3L6L616_9TRYP|nr:6-phosphofructo-2-kinase/fructose-2 [Trypanosoma brucei equiperdum]